MNSTNTRICYTGSHAAASVKQAMVDYLKEKGCRLDLLTMKTRNAFEWKEDLKGYDVIISYGEKYNREVIAYLSGSGHVGAVFARHVELAPQTAFTRAPFSGSWNP